MCDLRAVALRPPQLRRGNLALLKLGVQHLERAVRGEPGERRRRADEVGEPIRAAARERRRLRREERQARRHHDARVERGVAVHSDARVCEAVREPVRALLLDRLSGEAVQVAAADPKAASPRDGEQHHRAARERAHPDAHLLLRFLLGRAQPGGDDDGRVRDGAQDGKQQSAHQPGREHLQQELAPVGDEVRRLEETASVHEVQEKARAERVAIRERPEWTAGGARHPGRGDGVRVLRPGERGRAEATVLLRGVEPFNRVIPRRKGAPHRRPTALGQSRRAILAGWRQRLTTGWKLRNSPVRKVSSDVFCSAGGGNAQRPAWSTADRARAGHRFPLARLTV